MQFNSKTITLNNEPRIISEASVDVSYFLFPDLDEWAKKEAGDDEILEFFARTYYPNLAACTQPMPTLLEAYSLNGSLDSWYDAVREVNPDIFDNTEFTEEEVEFSDGKKITVRSIRPSVLLKRVTLENEARKASPVLETENKEDDPETNKSDKENKPVINIRAEKFRLIYYPLLAGCSFGDVPDYPTALAMSPTDKQLWYNAAHRQVYNWFMSHEQIAERNLEASQELDKKKSKRVRKS